MPSPLSTPGPWDLVSDGYETDTRPSLEQFSRRALAWLGHPHGRRAVDVAAGTGATSFLLAPAFERVAAIDFSPRMLDLLHARARRDGVANVIPHQMDGQSLAFADDTFDLGVSMFGVMFFPDHPRGLRELRRVLAPGAEACIATWPPAEESPGMWLVFETLAAAVPGWKRPPPPPDGLDSPARLRAALTAAGFEDVDTCDVTESFPLTTAEDTWMSLERGNAPLALMRSKTTTEAWADTRARAIEFLTGRLESGTSALTLKALLARGRKPLR